MALDKPEILAPAGDKTCFLAAVAGGADAVYMGLKHFSARMAAQNFSMAELAQLRHLADEKNVRMYIAMNVMAKSGDLNAVGRQVDKLRRYAKPDALIVQDLGVAAAARQAGYAGEIHLSTLANVTHPAALPLVHEKLGINRVILPRELSIDEIKQCDQACPDSMTLEVFVHGALCYGVSGRCYWSTYLGGKSSLRGRCVQPCRRMYSQGGGKARLFSCQDLSMDVLAKIMHEAPKVAGWKIEGRKKGPHYVYHATRAYKLLRDDPGPEEKKEALALLERALGRQGTRYNFLPQRPISAVAPEKSTASGLQIGRTKRERKGFSISCREKLLGGDVLRVGFEDEPWHQTVLVRKRQPKAKPLPCSAVKALPPDNTPVFLIDRKEPELMQEIKELQAKTDKFPSPKIEPSQFSVYKPKPHKGRVRTQTMHVNRRAPQGRIPGNRGLWLDSFNLKSVPQKSVSDIWWWLPPVIWPNEEEWFAGMVGKALAKGARKFVANAPWQAAFLQSSKKPLVAWAGPFCNAGNVLAINQMKKLDFKGVILSPELTREDYLRLPRESPLPLGIVTEGLWPLCVSRTIAEGVKEESAITSPMNETLWVRKYGQNYWVFPGWPMSLSAEKKTLANAGYALFIAMHEPWPKAVPRANRTSQINWNLKLL
ncbi:peptidase U32 family protein [Desulfatibacillum aliphaticivorans]|uniref:peptidase U32 family protein n=1 Tax=Desulfatibacillum aliphaticivorans TaxID=218208 RepID=UPI000408ACB5|nr:peptidase U32 family protein [Desulfatibacillum aliphaticivorans]